MAQQSIRARVFRFDPKEDEKPSYSTYEVPWSPGTSAMDVLDHIYHNLDPTVAYYDHAGCTLGICGRCTGRINGKPGLLCQTLVDGDVTLEPISEARVIRDLVVQRGDREHE